MSAESSIQSDEATSPLAQGKFSSNLLEEHEAEHCKSWEGSEATDLIAEALLTRKQWNAARELAASCGQEITKVLIEQRLVSPAVLMAAEQLQKLMVGVLLPKSFAIEALLLVDCSGLGVTEAIQSIGWNRRMFGPRTGLIRILQEAGVISASTVALLLKEAAELSFSLCSYLDSEKLLSPDLLNAALQVLCLEMQGELQPAQSAGIVRTVAETGLSLREALLNAGLNTDTILKCELSLGELLTSSGILTEPERAVMVEQSIFQDMRLGELIVSKQLTSSRVLDAALGLQKLALTGTIDKSEACQILMTVKSEASGFLAEVYAPFANA